MTRAPEFLILGICFMLPAQRSCGAELVARLLEVSGKAEVASPDGKLRSAATYGSVYAEEKIRLEPESKVVVGFHADGRLEKAVTDNQAREFTVTASSLLPRAGVSVIPMNKKQAPVVAKGIQGLPGISVGGVTILRGPSPEKPWPAIVPITDSTVLEDKPEFSWPGREGATEYELTVYSRKDRLHSITTQATRATYDARQALKPGRTYNWKVVALTPAGTQPVCEAEFTIEDARDFEGLAELAASEEPSLLALAASGYEKDNIIAKAIATYERLAERTPQAAAVHAALSDLYDRAGLVEKAQAARTRAEELGFQFKQRDSKQEADNKDQSHRLMLEKFQQLIAAMQNQQPVAPQAVIEILAWAATLPPEQAQMQSHAQQLTTLLLWDPLLMNAQAVADRDQGEAKLREAIAQVSKQMQVAGVPVHWSELGQLHLAAFQFHGQQYDALQETLDYLSNTMAQPDIWPGEKARYWNLRGLLASERSQFALAFEHHYKALRLRQQSNLHGDEAESLNNLGWLLLELGDYSSAKRRLDQARNIYQQFRQHPDYAKLADSAALVDINMSKALEYTRQFEESAALLRNVAELREDRAQQSFLDCLCQNNLGLVLYQLGNYRQSRAQLEAAHQTSLKINSSGNIHSLEVEVNLGWLDLAEQNLHGAKQHFQHALNVLEKSEPTHHRIAEIRCYLARVELLSENAPRATALLDAALQERREYLSRTLGSALSERDRLAFVQKLRVHTESIAWPGVLDTYLELAPQLEIPAVEQYRHVLDWKGILNVSDSFSADSSADPEIKRLQKEWSDLRQQLRQQTSETAESGELERDADEIERRLRRLQRSSAEGFSANVKDVIAALPKNFALLDVIETRRYQPREQGEVVRDNREYVGFLVHPAGEVTRLNFGDAAEIDSAIEQYVDRISSRRDSDRQATRVARYLAEPLQAAIPRVETLIIAADGWLHRVPWGALPGEERTYWIEETAFAMIASAQSILRNKGRPPDATASWLVVGGVEYGDIDPSASTVQWQPLANSATEARHIDQLLCEHYGDAQHGNHLEGIAADKNSIVALLPSRRIVHLATHGSFVDRQVDAFDIQGLAAQLDSFLVCASANVKEHATESLLTAEEIGNLDLGGVEIVSLSACETGLGHIRAGQGLIGLVGALERAGAQSVLSALWKVDDAATAQLMQTFYLHLLETESLGPIAATRLAQLELLIQSNGQYAHPFYWAAWNLTTRRIR